MKCVSKEADTEHAETKRAEVSVARESDRETEQGKQRETLKCVKHDSLVPPKCAETNRRADRGEERKAARRGYRGDECAERANAIKQCERTCHARNLHPRWCAVMHDARMTSNETELSRGERGRARLRVEWF
jgi:hypothetical protein